MLPEQVLPEGDLGLHPGRAQVAAGGVLGVRVDQPHVVLQGGYVGVLLRAVRAAAVPASAVLEVGVVTNCRFQGGGQKNNRNTKEITK